MRYLYLHGFASSPLSAKAQTLKARFQECGVTLDIPDLNQGDFTHLTLTRQIDQARQIILSDAEPLVLIGSSFGGLTSAWVAEQPDVQARIEKMVLLAPAFNFLGQWLPRLGPDQLKKWESEGFLSVYHYSLARQVPLHYGFVTDAQQYDDGRLQHPVPTLILHGRQDEVISVQASRDYAAPRPWVKLVELESDHALGDVQTEIWQAIQGFLEF